ncbi:MAG TPA: UvrD-helicase domain-containing protein, partial [Parvularculaceae bacterium]|nr:UvrD-helicase domain-containing protein [Parvularculaceae bacterium]
MNAAAFIKETTENQRRAAAPSLSAFVSANAGAGKTRVLTNRVARLLLEGVDPSTILCITFTKAAAAEMAERLFRLLGDWALAGDAELRKALVDLDGDDRARNADELARARRLFARALETPGGLKIQTIHSFCESVLKRFPLEAGVAPGFSVIEELESADLKRAAVERVAAAAAGDIAQAFACLSSRMTGKTLREFLEKALSQRRAFLRAEQVGWEKLKNELAETLGVDAGGSA